VDHLASATWPCPSAPCPLCPFLLPRWCLQCVHGHEPPPAVGLLVALAPKCTKNCGGQPAPLHLCLDNLHHVCALQFASEEGCAPKDCHVTLDHFPSDLTDSEMMMVVQHLLQTSGRTRVAALLQLSNKQHQEQEEDCASSSSPSLTFV